MVARGDIQTVKALLQARIADLVATLVPDGKLLHGYWMGTNPARTDNKPGSFWVVVSRPGKTPGAWRDEAIHPGPGGAGDVISLVAMCRGLTTGEALSWARKWLNFEELPAAAVDKARLDQQRQRKEADLKAQQIAEDEAKRAFSAWLSSKYEDRERKRPRDITRSVVGRYLASRGLDLEHFARLGHVPGVLGCLPRARHIGQDRSETFWPAMVAGMSDASGHIRAIHRTFLRPDGSGKAPVEPPRKIWPSYAGLAIRLWRGETGMSAGDAAKQGLLDTLVLCEGVEDGLSIALARPDYRVWAAASLSNLGNIIIPACAERVIVAADNDWGKPQAEKSLRLALEALASQGRPVLVARSPIGKDMNDCLRAEAQEKAA